MKYGDVTLGQLEAAINRLGGIEGFNALLADELVVSRKEPAQPKNVLKFNQEVAVSPPKKELDLKAFFKNRRGLYVWDSFKDRAGALLEKVSPTEATSLKSYDLAVDAYDREIKANAPENHEVALWEIAQLIAAQEGGKSGPLLTNGYANIFHLSGFVVRVRWSADGREWDVGVWDLDGSRWLAGCRAFFRN